MAKMPLSLQSAHGTSLAGAAVEQIKRARLASGFACFVSWALLLLLVIADFLQARRWLDADRGSLARE